jgi:hypothetical protein
MGWKEYSGVEKSYLQVNPYAEKNKGRRGCRKSGKDIGIS